jgi:hypothetical protein
MVLIVRCNSAHTETSRRTRPEGVADDRTLLLSSV